MPKNIVILVSFCLLTTFLYSQAPESYPRTFIGAYLGPNLSGFTGDYVANIEGETGKIRLRTQYGFFGKFSLNRDFSVFSGISLVLNGAMTKNIESSSGVSVSYVAKTNLSTLSIPGLFVFTPKEFYGLMIGPQFDYILSATEPWNRSDAVKPEGYEEDVIEKYNRFGMSLALGGYYLLLNGTTLHLRYTQGLTNMTKPEYGNAKPYSIQFYLGLNIYKKK